MPLSCSCNILKRSQTQVLKRVCFSIPFYKGSHSKGTKKRALYLHPRKQNISSQSFSATLQASTHLFDTCECVYKAKQEYNLNSTKARIVKMTVDRAWRPFFLKQRCAVYLTLSQNTTALGFMETFNLTGITSESSA